jgi:4-amino-4-deoxy-L-arabinose transferase-like glycosyltransferase
MIVLVNPIGNFPLNDDWSYGKSVYYLVKEGKLQFTGWVSMPLIAQVIWGALFCLPFGFSFTALRISTLVLGLIGVISTYWILKEIKANKLISFFGSLIVATNPLYFELSNTFMTDVPFFGFSMLSLLFFIRGMRNEKVFEIIIGTLLACAATLIRQLGIAIPLSFGIIYLIKNGIKKKTILIALIPFIFCCSILFVYQIWLKNTLGLPALYHAANNQLLNSFKMPVNFLISYFLKNNAIALTYLGLFLFPFLIAVISKPKSYFYFIIFLIFFVSIVEILQGHLMPLKGNILFDIGLGPPTLHDVYILLPNLPKAPKLIWLIITIVGITGAALLLYSLLFSIIKLVRFDSDNRFVLLLIILIYIFYSFSIALVDFFDRYLIFLIPLLMVIAISISDRLQIRIGITRFISILILIIYTIFTVGATHDYISWNRARWNALHYLTNELHIPYEDIDGGFEFNGWYGYDPKYQPQFGKSWWWVKNDNYIISFGHIPNYTEIKRYPYKRYIPPGNAYIFILKK